MSILLTFDSKSLNQNGADMRIPFNPPLQFQEDYEIALVSANMWYTFYNITAALGNNIFRYSPDGGSNYFNLTIPDGIYQISQLEAEIHRQLEAASHFNSTTGEHYIRFTPNESTLRLIIELSNSYYVDFVGIGLRNLLGFGSVLLTSTTEGTSPVDITLGVIQYYINCDLVSNTRINGAYGQVIYDFVPATRPGSQIQIREPNRLYLPLNQRRVDSIRLWTVDNLNRIVNFNGEPVSITLHLRPIK